MDKEKVLNSVVKPQFQLQRMNYNKQVCNILVPFFTYGHIYRTTATISKHSYNPGKGISDVQEATKNLHFTMTSPGHGHFVFGWPSTNKPKRVQH